MDHKRRLFHDIWLLPSLPTHSMHCLYIATDLIPDNLRLILDDCPPLRLSPMKRHPILSARNLEHTPLGVLTKAYDQPTRNLSNDSSASIYDHLSDPAVPIWSDILNDRPVDPTLGSDRRHLARVAPSSYPTTPSFSSMSSRSWPISQDDDSHHTLLNESSPPWHRVGSSTASRASRLPPASSPPPESGPVTPFRSDNPSLDDRLSQLLDQMSALTNVVASLASRIPPPSPPPPTSNNRK
jgi:hypothetical protein